MTKYEERYLRTAQKKLGEMIRGTECAETREKFILLNHRISNHCNRMGAKWHNNPAAKRIKNIRYLNRVKKQKQIKQSVAVLPQHYVVMDIEWSNRGHTTQLCMIEIKNGVERVYDYICSGKEHQARIHEKAKEIIDRVGVLVGHSIRSDLSHLRDHGIEFSNLTLYDTQRVDKVVHRQRDVRSLGRVYREWVGESKYVAHTAYGDVRMTLEVAMKQTEKENDND